MQDLLSFTADEEWASALPDWHAVCSTPEARRLILLGVPRHLQARLWRVSFVDGGTETEASYAVAAAAAGVLRERLDWDWDGSLRRSQPRLDELAVVSADVPRTMPESQRRGSLDGAQLQCILDAFVASQAGADGAAAGSNGQGQGYTQGMADVAAWLLTFELPPWQSYACLHSLVRRPLLRAVMGLDQGCWDALGTVYLAHLKRGVPAVAQHLERVGLQPFFFLPEWLVALWTRSLPVDAAALAWNLLLVEGDVFFLLSCAVGVTRAIAPLLTQQDDLAACRDVCRDAPRQLSREAFQQAALASVVEPALLRPLAPWVDSPCQPAATMFEL